MCEILANYKERLFNWGSYAIVRPKSNHPASFFDLSKAAGAGFWSIGIETGVDRIRFEMDKKFTNDDVDWHLEQSQRVGIQNNFLNMPTWPSETLEEHQEYLQMFKRWRNYAVDGTIFGIRVSPVTVAIPNTRLHAQQSHAFEFDHEVPKEIAYSAWRSKSNPELTHKEKIRRTLAIYEAAIDNDWPLNNRIKNLQELKYFIDAFAKIPNPKTIIPIQLQKDS
jgi:hypothetical protein